VKLTSK